jgi:ribosome biogenesis GTPase
MQRSISLTLPVTETVLQQLGWDDGWEAAFEPHLAAGLAPARVGIQHRGAYDVFTEEGELRVPAAPRLARDGELPAVGDWVGVDRERGFVEAVLPRRTQLSRKEVWQATREQVLAANVDVAFLVQALPYDYNPRRLERYLVMARESGASPAIILTKPDLASDLSSQLNEVTTLAGDIVVHVVNPKVGEGLEHLRQHLAPGRTAALLGSSGVGKSTIINRLVGTDVRRTQEVRPSDSRGRHTTTHRELVMLPDGGLIIDTPGMRELQLWDASESVKETFEEIEALAPECHFGDCRHRDEPRCAVKAALAEGKISADRLESYLKVQEELAELARQQTERAWKEKR